VIDRLNVWMAALEARQLSDLTFQEVSRSLRALSSTYVERRQRLGEGAALAGAGKRAAFALFYGPLHFLTVHHIVSALGHPFTSMEALVDLGCGTGSSSAGWGLAGAREPGTFGVDRHPWAVEEARRTYADLRMRATFRVDDLIEVPFNVAAPSGRRNRQPKDRQGTGVLLAYAANEIAEAERREKLLTRLMNHASGGGKVLVVEPLAGFVAPWWGAWQRRFEGAKGRATEWRFRVEVPPIVEKLGRAAGLNYREIKARTLTV
jgi:hypothetical protein